MSEVLEAPARPAFANFVGGAWVESLSGETYEKRGPWRPSEPIGSFPSSGEADVDRAVRAARDAVGAWAAMPAAQRGTVLSRAADAVDRRVEQIAQDMTLEMGKPIREARLEAARMAQILRFFAGEGFRSTGERFEQAATGSVVYTMRRSVGVVGMITPWNFPAAIPAWKAAPALAYGNTVVMKLAQEAPLTGLHLAACFEEAELPAGVFNVVIGRGPAVGTPLVAHQDVRAISFTGSVPVGEQVRDKATSLGKRVQLELGGHNPAIVMADADLDRAAELVYAGAFWSAGQKCTATRRVYVEDEVYEDFKTRLLVRMERGVVGDPTDPETEVGPIVNEAQLEEVLAGIGRGRADGGTLLAGGERLNDEAYLLAPTLFEGLADDAFLSCEELFGPVTSLYRFNGLDEALARANGVRFGLSAAIFTSSLASARIFAQTIEAGIVRINGQTAGADVHVPFGGIKGSGYGPHEQGRAALEFYTDVVTVYEDV
ncbi:MAG: aldehyde dehydrogenase family protein [Gaiellaceae bacterium]